MPTMDRKEKCVPEFGTLEDFQHQKHHADDVHIKAWKEGRKCTRAMTYECGT
jgi:hypothetical protein